MVEHASFLRISHYHPRPADRQEFVAAAGRLCERARAAEGCYGAQVCVSDLEPETVVVVSRWRSPADVERARAAASGGPEAMDVRRLGGDVSREDLTSVQP